MQQKEILKQNLLINLKKCFNNSQIVFYYVPKISHKFGEYLCTVNLSTNEELNFTDIGLVYKYKSQEKFIKYSEIGDVFIYSSDRIGIVSEDKLQLIILTNIKAKVLKETLDTIILSTWESNNFSKDTDFLFIFFHIEYGLFVLPKILHFTLSSKMIFVVNFLSMSSIIFF